MSYTSLPPINADLTEKQKPDHGINVVKIQITTFDNIKEVKTTKGGQITEIVMNPNFNLGEWKPMKKGEIIFMEETTNFGEIINTNQRLIISKRNAPDAFKYIDQACNLVCVLYLETGESVVVGMCISRVQPIVIFSQGLMVRSGEESEKEWLLMCDSPYEATEFNHKLIADEVIKK